MKVNWLFDTFLTDDRTYKTGFSTLHEAAIEAGHTTYQTKYVPGSLHADSNIPFHHHECVITYGTHEFVKQIKKDHPRWIPGYYHRIENLSYSAYAPYIGDLLLNDDFVLLPFSELVRRKISDVFIRPNVVTKLFTGFIINKSEFDYEINSLIQINNISADTLIVIAKPKKILGEFRFIIANREVITGSEYSWDNRLDIRTDVHPLCLDMAKEVAAREWQADIVYVCDVALTEINEEECAKVVELNTFSCAGLYACDTRKIIEAVSKVAWMEHIGDLP